MFIFTTNHTNQHEQEDLLFKDECYELNGCIYAVNRKLGSGFLEAVYQEVLEIESKAVSKINNQHKAQLMNYISATGFKLGLLVNFKSYPKAEIIRMVK